MNKNFNLTGNTSRAEKIITESLERGDVIYIDAKGDKDLMDKVYNHARDIGREEDIFFVNFNTSSESQKIKIDMDLNNLDYTDEAINQIVAHAAEDGLTLSYGKTIDGMTTSFGAFSRGRTYYDLDLIKKEKEKKIKYLNETCTTRQVRRKRERMAKKLNKK